MDMQAVIAKIAGELSGIGGVEAVVLGGSRARGTHHPGSDIDIGIYYSSEADFDLAALSAYCGSIDDRRRADVVTPVGEWGPWINGGGWLAVGGMPLDLLYRDLAKVRRTVEDCRNGMITIDYQPGHPHGFVNGIYMAEIALCKPLRDPQGIVGALKALTVPYPQAMKRAMLAKFQWEAAFAADGVSKSAARRDTAYAAGCCFRAASCLAQSLFALNGQYCMNEKGAADLIESFAVRPANYKERLDGIFGLLSADGGRIAAAADALKALIADVDALIPEEMKR